MGTFDDLIPVAPSRGGSGMFDDLIPAAPQQDRAPLRITVSPFRDRYAPILEPDNSSALRESLNQRALEMTRGPELSPTAQMVGQHQNLLSAASQGTNPHISNYGGRLVSTEAFEDDAGNILYKDPQTGQIKPTNKSTQVALRDPADNIVKVFDRSSDTDENPMVGVSRVLSPGLMAGAPTARAMIPEAPANVVKAVDVLSTAKPYYRAFDAIADNINVPANQAASIVNRVKSAMISQKVPEHLADEVFKSVGEVSKGVAPKALPYWERVQAEMNGLPTTTPGTPISLSHLRDVKELIGQSSRSADSRVRQAAAIASKELNAIISEISREAGSKLRTADEIFSTSKSLQDIQRKSSLADMRTGRAGYGGNAVNNMRQTLGDILKRHIEGKPTNLRPEEIAAVKEIVEGNRLTNALRMASQFAPSKGGWSAIPGIGTAGATWAVGGAANKLNTILTGKQIERLQQLIAKRSPAYSAAVTKAVERYEKAQMAFINQPTPAKLSAYVSASRALSAGLTRDGIPVASSQLLRAIEGPMKSAAEEEEPSVPRGQGKKPDKN